MGSMTTYGNQGGRSWEEVRCGHQIQLGLLYALLLQVGLCIPEIPSAGFASNNKLLNPCLLTKPKGS